MGGTSEGGLPKGSYHSDGTVGISRLTMSWGRSSGRTTLSRIWPTTSSMSTRVGMRYCSARLKARTVSSKASCTEAGARAMMGWSPWVPQRACMTSPWEGLVGRPVLGPARITLTMTHGTSATMA